MMKIYHGILLNVFSIIFIYLSFDDTFVMPDILRIITPICGGIVLFTSYQALKMIMAIIYMILKPLVDYIENIKDKIHFPWEAK